MNHLPPFLRFAPIYKDYLWGGNRIASIYGRTDAPTRAAESWELSAHPDGDSAVEDGPLSGRTLSSLVSEFGRDLLGTRSPSATRFPLLCKVIDARDSLSVQVHPSPADPSANPDEYKNECWHLLGAAPGTTIFAGVVPEIGTRDTLAALAATDSKALAAALVRHAPRVGETLYIPAGLVHAIGAGALIYEVQQNSNTTYRLYDWDRRGPDGKPRALHFNEALRSIDFSLPPPRFVAPVADGDGGQDGLVCLRTPYFTIREFGAAAVRRPAGLSFEAIFVKEGAWRVEAEESAITLASGDSLLVAANCREYRLTPMAPVSSVLVTTL